MDLAKCNDRLSKAGVKFDAGLTSSEIASIEQAYGFRFPPDLAEFLGFGLPVSTGWIDWRRASQSEIERQLNWPYEGICFDIRHNGFWRSEWGERPMVFADACNIARKAVDAAPRLIPIYSHRYIPDRPREQGNPVLSVYQTDIIYYGADLFDYVCNEFPAAFGRERCSNAGPMRQIEFWSDLIDSCGN